MEPRSKFVVEKMITVIWLLKRAHANNGVGGSFAFLCPQEQHTLKVRSSAVKDVQSVAAVFCFLLPPAGAFFLPGFLDHLWNGGT
jgi:hypothetical protein